MGRILLNPNTVNVILAAVVIALGTIAFAGWLSPKFLRSLAVRLLARAESLDAMRTAHPEALKYWGARMERAERARLAIVAGGERP